MLSVLLSFGQGEMSVFDATGRAGVVTTFATDYESIGINPSNLGWEPEYEDKKGAYGMAEGTYSAYSEALTKPVFREILTNFDDPDIFGYDQKKAAAEAFTNTPLSVNIDIMALGFAYRPSEKVGGFAFSVRERIQWYSTFNKQVSELIFLGYNADYFDIKLQLDADSLEIPVDTAGLDQDAISDILVKGIASPENQKMFSELFDGSSLSLSWFRELNLSYGRMLVTTEKFKIYGGIGIKYLMGVAMAEVKVENGEFIAYSSTSPALGLDYGSASKVAQGGGISSWIPEPVGGGFGLDIGASIVIGEKLRIGLALNDIGSITWEGNLYISEDDTLIQIEDEGLNNYNIINGAKNLVTDDGMMDWKSSVPKTVSLPMGLRAGISYKPVKQVALGADLVIPTNNTAGSYKNTIMAAGIDVTVLKFFHLSTGFSIGGNSGANIPIGITLITGGGSYECGIASRDAVTFFTNNNPHLSLSLGFMRFRF